MKVMVTENIDVNYKICNGTIGIILNIGKNEFNEESYIRCNASALEYELEGKCISYLASQQTSVNICGCVWWQRLY